MIPGRTATGSRSITGTMEEEPGDVSAEPRPPSCTPRVSVLIPNWNRRLLLAKCLQSLRHQTFLNYEVFVIDNGSKDGSLDLVREEFPNVRCVALPVNRGFSAAINAGLRESRAPLIALLNNDTVVDPEWLAALVRTLDSRPDVSFCASKVLLHDRRDLADTCGDYYSRSGFSGKIGFLRPASDYTRPAPVLSASAAAAIYRRSLFDDVGLFDEDFFVTHEDTDLSLRARLKGHRCLYVPSAIVYHRLSATLKPGSWRHLYFTHRNEEYVYLKDMPSPLFQRSLAHHCLTNARRLAWCFRSNGLRGVLAFLLAKAAAAGQLLTLLRKRRLIQRQNRITPDAFERDLQSADW